MESDDRNDDRNRIHLNETSYFYNKASNVYDIKVVAQSCEILSPPNHSDAVTEFRFDKLADENSSSNCKTEVG